MTTHKPVEVEQLYGELEIGETVGKWYVVYTKPRQEKKLAEYAFKRNINYYLPLKESIRHYKYRKIKFTKPLFPGYIFIRIDLKERQTLLISGCIVNFLKVKDQKGLLEDLIRIRDGLAKGADLRKTDFLEKGSWVEIISGPFRGLTGVVKDHKNVEEVVLQVNILRQAVSVAASTSQVKLLSKRRGN